MVVITITKLKISDIRKDIIVPCVPCSENKLNTEAVMKKSSISGVLFLITLK